MIYVPQFLEYVIEPVLACLGRNTPATRNLLLMTMAVESDAGKYLKQYPTGPALGVYQMEPATHVSIWDDFLLFRPDIRKRLEPIAHSISLNERLIYDLAYATAMAFMKYWWAPKAFPKEDDVEGLAWYWRKYYNGNSPALSDDQAVTKAIAKYNCYIISNV